MTIEYPVKSFKTAEEWEQWLEKNHTTEGIWIQFFKKSSNIETINHAQALDEALCFGWIDGQAKPFDDISWLQKFTPRRPRSMWSKRNIEHIERLTKLGKMRRVGLEEVDRAKADGRWKAAYNSPSKMTFPPDFIDELAKNKKAQAFFESLNKTNKYAIAWRLQTAKKPATRARRMKVILEKLAREEKFH